MTSTLRLGSSGTRIERMSEAVTVLKRLFGDGPTKFEGRHYKINGFADLPRPVQRPHPPLMIGGGGQKTLTFAAREADIYRARAARHPPRRVRRPQLHGRGDQQKIDWVREAAHDRYVNLEFNTYPTFHPVTIADDPRSVARQLADRLKQRYDAGLSEDEILESSTSSSARSTG